MTSPLQHDEATITVTELDGDQWARLRAVRLAALRESPRAFGATYDELVGWDEAAWRRELDRRCVLVADLGGRDAGVMSVEGVDGDFGATCWIGGCWTDPALRGRGVLRGLMDYLVDHAGERGWEVQGLGVWTENHVAIAAYEALGFVRRGEDKASSTHPGQFYQRMIRVLD